MKVIAVEARASIKAPTPKAAVPPSVRQACFLLTRKPQIKSEAVNRRDKVALQTFWTALAIEVSLPSVAESLRGTSCMIAATMASGPSRMNMRRFSRLEGNSRVKNCMCVI